MCPRTPDVIVLDYAFYFFTGGIYKIIIHWYNSVKMNRDENVSLILPVYFFPESKRTSFHFLLALHEF